MSSATLLEREDLLRELNELMDLAKRGKGSLALVGGEAGAGKTALANELADSAGDSAVTLVGMCDPLATPRPLSPLLDFAADPDSAFGEVVHGDAQGTELFAAVLDRLRNTARPTLMIIEDIHWADDATRDFIRFIGRRVDTTSALVVATYRDDEITVDHPLQVVLGQLTRLASTHRLDVPALTKGAVAQLAEGRPVDVDRVYTVTGGNAFYVTEVVGGGEELPASVQDAVLARVGRLDTTGRRLVEAVSIAPRALETEYIGPLCGAGEGEAADALGSGVVIADGSTLRFRHELARAAVEQSIPAMRRLALHRRMLELLGDLQDAARLAHHAVRTEDAELIATYAPAAAEDAVERGARRQAAEFYEAALRNREFLPPDTVARLQRDYGEQLRFLGRIEASVVHLEAAAAYYERAGDVFSQADALARASRARWYIPDRAGSRNTLNQAIELLEPLGASVEFADALVQSASLWMLSRQRAPADAALERAAPILTEIDSEAVGFSARVIAACNEIGMGDASSGLDALSELRHDAERRGHRQDRIVVLGMMGSGGGETRHYDTAIPALQETVRLSMATDDDFATAYGRSWLARIAFEQGRWDDVAPLVELATSSGTGSSDPATVTANGALGRVRVRRGDPQAIDLLEQSVATGDNVELQHVWSPLCGLAEHAWLQGDAGAIEDILGETWLRALQTDSVWAHGEVGFWMWKSGLVEGPTEQAAEPFALHMSGRWRESAEAWRKIGCPYEVGLALADGDDAAMVEAVAIFDGLGARPAATMVRTRLKDLGVTAVPRGPSTATRTNPAGLTNRQLEVLRLVVAGKSNGEIAEALFVSKKTVEHHVSAIFTKLGVDTRAMAIATAGPLLEK